MPLTVFRRGQIWHYRGTVAGRRLRGSTETSDKARAERIAAEKEARAWKSHLDGPASVLTFAQAAILYREAGKPTRFLAKVEDHWKDTPVRSITPGAIRQAAITLYPRCIASTRNRQAIVPTQAIINHAAEMELCQPVRVKRFPVGTKEREPVTRDWIEAFMAHANPHLGALACFMFATGARISEALAVQWGDIDFSTSTVLIRQTKVSAERRSHMPLNLVAAIANIEEPRKRTVFKYSSRDTAKPQWRKAVDRAGIKRLSFHACRHGFATSMLQAGVDPITVAKLGGWKTAAHVFATYGHAMDDITVTDRLFGTDFIQDRYRDSDIVKKSKGYKNRP